MRGTHTGPFQKLQHEMCWQPELCSLQVRECWSITFETALLFLSATLIFSFHSIYFSAFVCGKNTIIVFSVEMLLHLFGSFSGSSPCLPHLPATAQPVVLVQNQGNKFMRGKNAAITKAACFHLHFPRWVVIITPFPPSCGIYILAQARCCFVRHHEQIWTKALESFLGA